MFPSCIAMADCALMLPVFFRRPFKMMFAERADSPVTFGEFLCATLLLAGVVAAIWLAARPWEEPEDPCLRGSYIIKSACSSFSRAPGASAGPSRPWAGRSRAWTWRASPRSSATSWTGTTPPSRPATSRSSGRPGLLRVLEGPDQEAEAPGGGRPAGAQDAGAHRLLQAPVLGTGEPAERAAQDAALHGRPPLPGRHLLLLRQPLPQAHQDLGHAALRPAATVLQGLPLRELPRRAPPHQGAARQPLPAAALYDPP